MHRGRRGFRKVWWLGFFLSIVLCVYLDSDSEMLKAAKVCKLAETLVGEKQQYEDARSQQKEQTVLLEKKSATYSEVCWAEGWHRSHPLFQECIWGTWLSDLPFLLFHSSPFPALFPFGGGSGASPLPGLAAETASGAPAKDTVWARPHQRPVPGGQMHCYGPEAEVNFFGFFWTWGMLSHVSCTI